MKKVVKLALVLLVLASCAPQTRLVKIQRTQIIDSTNHVLGPPVHIKLTNKQLEQLLKREDSSKKNLADKGVSCPLYPVKQYYYRGGLYENNKK
jgi:hypothetical protein